jgi:hypothetical protein
VYERTHAPVVLRKMLSVVGLDGEIGESWPVAVLDLTVRDPKGMLSAASGSQALTERLGSFLFQSDVPRDERDRAIAILKRYASGPDAGLAHVARECLKERTRLATPATGQ